MTRQEFIENVNLFGELISFCQDECIDICDDVYDADYFNQIIIDIIDGMRDWEEIRSLINGIPSGCEYYREDGYGGYDDADCYFNDYKNDVIRYMDDTGAWDEEDEDLEEEYDEQTYCTEPDGDIETHSFMAVLGRAS